MQLDTNYLNQISCIYNLLQTLGINWIQLLANVNLAGRCERCVVIYSTFHQQVIKVDVQSLMWTKHEPSIWGRNALMEYMECYITIELLHAASVVKHDQSSSYFVHMFVRCSVRLLSLLTWEAVIMLVFELVRLLVC